MKIIAPLIMLYCLTGVLRAQYEEGMIGTTGFDSVENRVEKGTLIVIGRFYDNIEGGYAGGGGSHFDARMVVDHVLYGDCASEISVAYVVLPKSGKNEDGKYRQIAGRFDPPADGTQMIAIGEWFYNREKQRTTHLTVRRYLYVTTENLERVSRLIRQYKAKDLAADPAATERLEQNLTNALSDVTKRTALKSVAERSPESSIASALVITLFTLLILGFAVFLWRRGK